jgi:hypothetical protein
MCQRCFGGCLCTEQMVYSLLNQFGFDVIFHAAKVVLLFDIAVDDLSTNDSRYQKTSKCRNKHSMSAIQE